MEGGITQEKRSTFPMIRPDRVNEQVPRWKRYMIKLDIFAFLPVPRTDPVSTKASLWGSYLLIIIFSAYVIYSFISFLIVNVPRVNQYKDAIDDTEYELPQVAIAFFFGDKFDKTINDPSLFTFSMQQVTKSKYPDQDDIKINIPLVSCKPNWIPVKDTFPMLCPAQKVFMSGLLYSTEKFNYPRFLINFCNPLQTTCQPLDQLYSITSGGRVLMYLKNQGENINLATGKQQNGVQYQTFQFFLDPGLYLRSEIVIQKQTYIIKPDYFTQFTEEISEKLVYANTNYYLTNVTYYNQQNGYQIWIRLDQDQLFVDVVPQTFIDMVSKWGAFWGVLFAIFAFIFLRFNMKKFYTKNPEWNKFDEKMDAFGKKNDEEQQKIINYAYVSDTVQLSNSNYK